MTNAPSNSPFSFENAQADQAANVSPSHLLALDQSWWQHVLAILLVITCTFIAGVYLDGNREIPLLLSIGVISGYYTLICCWWVFGKHFIRFLFGSVLFGALFIVQIIIAALGPAPPLVSLIYGFLIANAGFVALKMISVVLLRWISKIEIRNNRQSDESVSPRIRYGLGEIMLLTTMVAVMVAIAKGLDARAFDLDAQQSNDQSYQRILVVLSCISVCHFLIFWPLLFAGFAANLRWLMILVSILVFSLVVYAQAPLFDAVLGLGVKYAEILMLDVTFLFTIVVHFAIVNLNGYHLVQKVKIAPSVE